jgi:hypothetical protein
MNINIQSMKFKIFIGDDSEYKKINTMGLEWRP